MACHWKFADGNQCRSPLEDVENGGCLHVWGREIKEKFLYLPLNFAENLKLLQKIKSLHCKSNKYLEKKKNRDCPGGPVAKNMPSSAGDTGSTPGQRTKIPHVMGQLSPQATTRETHTLQPPSPHTLEPVLRNRRSLHTATKSRASAVKKINKKTHTSDQVTSLLRILQ